MAKAAFLSRQDFSVANLRSKGPMLRGLSLPACALALIMVILRPLPPEVMDLLLVANITVSAVVLVTVMYMRSPLEFSSFPSLLLALTLFRLVLNVATTRLILTNAQNGELAAGRVIQVFGKFVAQDSIAVAVIIFAIICIIQFVVITKGATRIAEVAARFTLDGMPGKQMAVDADLNAGTITEAEAKSRRAEITREADFYGAMDGASKFVRGDAIAGIIITIVNIVGGMYVGLAQLGMGLRETVEVFTILTVGDGLVSQIPAFIVSIGAAMIVTRSPSKENLGSELLGQMTSQPAALLLAGGFLAFLMLTPLPKVPLLGLGTGCVVIAQVLHKGRARDAADAAARARVKSPDKERPESYLAIDPMELEVGYGLIRLVDRKQGGDLLDRITNLRRQIAQDMGIVVPPIRIRDNIQLQPNYYAIKVKGLEVARSEVLPGHLLAIDSGTVTTRISGVETTEPAFGLRALWVADSERAMAEARNYTVVPPTSVIATHLTEIIKRHADVLLSRQEVNRLLDAVRERSPKLLEELVPTVIKPGEIQGVLQRLLRERVPVRDLETILEVMGDCAPRSRDPDIVAEYVRHALARMICHLHGGNQRRIQCITLDPQIEELISGNLRTSEGRSVLGLAPALQQRIVAATRQAVEQALPNCGGNTPVIICAPPIRLWVRRLIEGLLPNVAVLSFNEIVREMEVEARGMVVLDEQSANVSS